MAKRRRKRRNLLRSLADSLLTLVDRLCEGLAALLVGLLRLIGRGLWLLLCSLWRLLLLLLRGLSLPFVWLFRRLSAGNRRAEQCLRLTGVEFEDYMALVLADNGFKNVELTPPSGDQGVDILCERGGKRYAIQCKNYDGAVGNFAVQEAFAGAQYYGCDAAVVVCPRFFTRAARELAESTGVLLWDGKRLTHMMKRSGRKPRHRE